MLNLNDTKKECDFREYNQPPSKDLVVQLVLSSLLGVTALIAFCILRPRWPALYAARTKRLDPAIGLPALGDSFLGWMPRLYRVTEQQILASAGLDAFVFLAFFKMAIRLFAAMTFLAVVVLLPINAHYRNFQLRLGGNNTDGNETHGLYYHYTPVHLPLHGVGLDGITDGTPKDQSREKTFLWAYVTFTYFFVGLTLYSINWETFRIIQLRQDYLGSQSTVTDRTFRLTGVPPHFRSEARITALIAKLGIGKVDSVTVCRDWSDLDDLVAERDVLLRKLEASWARYMLSQREALHSNIPSQSSNGATPESDAQLVDRDEEAAENWRLLAGHQDQPHVTGAERPQVSLRYGIFGLRSKTVDAIDYYEEKLRRMDDKVVKARKKDYKPTGMVLVTMDSVASCQMVIQAQIDPRPGRFLAKSAPSPSDLVWRNTYARRGIRRLKSWAITLFITFLTLIWIFPTAILASWLSICTMKQVVPSVVHWLKGHSIIYSLVQNGLPTLVVSLLNVAVPYLYDWLSKRQGMISNGDVELSLISKNFFFTFFNTFFVFAVSRTGFDFFSTIQGFLKDTSKIPEAIARDVEQLSIFYINFIMLQGIGLMPFRILEVGSVILFPIYRLLARTPRDYAELQKPPVFQYGFYLPTSLLIFNLCLIYSVVMPGCVILAFGTLYFTLGYFTFKYMLLYAMDQPQHATGGAWRIICYRIVIGLLVFEVVMVGQIASLAAFVQSVAVFPLIPFTIWYSYYFKRRFEPLTKYIALRAMIPKYGSDDDGGEEAVEDEYEDDPDTRHSRSQILLRRGSTLDELKEKGLTFVNPSLIVPLRQPWIYKDPPPLHIDDDESTDTSSAPDLESRPAQMIRNVERSLGIGDDNVWMDLQRDD